MKKLLILLAVLTACLVVFAACDAEKPPEGTTADNKTTVAPTPGENEPAATEKGPDSQTEPVTESGGETHVPTDTDSGEETVGETTPPETTHTHAWGDWSTAKEATCTENGVSERTCACGEKEEEAIDALGHTPGAEATCTTNQTCTVCGTELTAAKGHTPGAEATCTTNQTCTVCGIELTAAKGHTPGAEATCTAAQTCTVCGTELAAALGHTEVIDAAVAPTVTESGLTEGKHCSVCDEVLVEQEVVPATGSIGLAYELNNGGTAYIVTGIGTCEDSAVYIPEVYNGLPVTEIARRAFYNCATMTEITIPASIKTIGTQIFYKAENLHTVYYNSSYGSSDNPFFSQSSVEKIVFGGMTVPEYVLYNRSAAVEVVISDSVTSIGRYAFYGCTGLTSFVIPDSVTSIGDYAFQGCAGLTSIVIPDSVTSIGDSMFYDCTGLKDMYIAEALIMCTIDYGDIFGLHAYGSLHILDENGNEVTDLVIPDSVTRIGQSAFRNCTGLTSIVIPDSVTSIGGSAFYGCTGLTSITIPDSVTSIGDYAFRGCTVLTSVVIPDSVMSIGDYAFRGCTGLTSIVIPDSVTSIGSYAFSESGLTDIYYTGTPEEWVAISKGSNLGISKVEIHYNA